MLRIFALLVVGIPPFVAAAGPTPEAVVTLFPAHQVVKQGIAPIFQVQVVAVGGPLRVMRFGKREDLLDSYARIRVTQNGLDVRVPVMISDPGPLDDSAYEVLALGQTISFEHRGTPLGLMYLPPGEYSATVTVQADYSSEPIRSNAVTFSVDPR